MKLPVQLRPAPRRWSLRERPPFIEAYPMLSVGEAHRRSRSGEDHVIWRDRNAVVAGAARIEWLDPATLLVEYTIDEQPYFNAEAGRLTLAISWKGSQKDNRRPFAACPLCRRSVDVLVFAATWCCGSRGHGLRHRSAGLSKEVRWSEALVTLEGAIAAAEAVGTTGRLLSGQMARRDDLRERLGGRVVTANALQLAIVTSEWVRPIGTAPE